MLTNTARTLLATSFIGSAFAAPTASSELSERASSVITPKVMIVSTFEPERTPWIEPSQLYSNISFIGASPLFPDVACDIGLTTCIVTTGEGLVNAASTIMALTLSPKFDLTLTYFLVAGIAGISSDVGTLGSAAWARFVVQGGLAYELDGREIPSNWTDSAWALGTKQPGELPDPMDLYGTEVFELNTNLLDRVYNLTKDVKLNDSAEAIEFRKQYDSAPANEPPTVILGDSLSSDTYYAGDLLTKTWENYFNMMTTGQGKYATTNQEDSAILESLVRADDGGLIDYSRVMLLRTGSDFDRAPNSTTDAYDAFYESQMAGGFDPATQNLQIVGSVVVKDIIDNWDTVYMQGVAPQGTQNGSFYGDDIATLRPNGTAQARSKFRRSFMPEAWSAIIVSDALVLEKVDAVKSMIAISKEATSESPTAHIFAAPSLSAASMIIELLFPSLDDENEPVSTNQTALSPLTIDTPKAKPFALSNLAWEAGTSSPSSPSNRNLSPKIAQALEQLEATQRRPEDLVHEDRSRVERRTFGETDEAHVEEDRTIDDKYDSEARSTFPVSALPLDDFLPTVPSVERPRPSSSSAFSTSLSSTTSASSSTSFKARPAPPPPTAQPRMTKSSALRMGIPLPPTTPRAKSSSSIETLSSLSTTTPRVIPQPKSLAAPSVTPRMTKSSALRTGQALPTAQTPRPAKRQSISTSERAALDRLTRRQSVQLPIPAVPPIPVEVRMSKAAMLRMGIPIPEAAPRSHSRQSSTSSYASTSEKDPSKQNERRTSVSASLKSLREPAVVPRSTKSSSLRTGTANNSPTKARRGSIAILDDVEEGEKRSTFEGIPGHKRRESIQVESTQRPAVEVRMSRASLLRSGQAVAAPAARTGVSTANFDGVPGHKRRESIAVPSMHQPPTHTPRPNRASLLRQKSDSATHPVPTRRPASALASISAQSRTTGGPVTPRLNRAAELRLKASESKEQRPSSPGARSANASTKTSRPTSAMSDLSNGGRI
ncbi:hypothetical protein JCM5353_007644 [Sporobolomyces roseus]